MKQKDIAALIVVAVVSAILSLGISHFVPMGSVKRGVSVEKVQAISTDFQLPDTKYFNSKSIDPTQIIRINENDNSKPFDGQ